MPSIAAELRDQSGGLAAGVSQVNKAGRLRLIRPLYSTYLLAVKLPPQITIQNSSIPHTGREIRESASIECWYDSYIPNLRAPF